MPCRWAACDPIHQGRKPRVTLQDLLRKDEASQHRICYFLRFFCVVLSESHSDIIVTQYFWRRFPKAVRNDCRCAEAIAQQYKAAIPLQQKSFYVWCTTAGCCMKKTSFPVPFRNFSDSVLQRRLIRWRWQVLMKCNSTCMDLWSQILCPN